MIKEGYRSKAKDWGNYTAKKVARLRKPVECVVISVTGINRSRIKFALPLWVKRTEIDMIVQKIQDILESVLTRS